MDQIPVARRVQNMMALSMPVMQFINTSRWSEKKDDPEICDFVLGNPHDMPLEGFSSALQHWSVPQNKDWFAYKMSEPGSQKIVAASLQKSHGMPFEPEDIFMTNGAFAALAIALGTITEPGDEIIYISPPWFFYETMIVFHYGQPVRVKCDPENFNLDLNAIRAAITPRTRGIIINSPNNPTGRIYPPETLRALASLLTGASEQNGRTIYLLSDEFYRRIVYDDIEFISPTTLYPESFLIYTYGKTLLTPGQRIGYLALPPMMQHKEMMRSGLFISQLVSGYSFPNALLQHALEDLEKMSIDISRLQDKRNRLAAELIRLGYDLHSPEGTFYLLVRSPLEDDMEFIDLLADQNVYCLPGTVFEMPGFFRISLTANEEMIEKSLPGFAQAIAISKKEKARTSAD